MNKNKNSAGGEGRAACFRRRFVRFWGGNNLTKATVFRECPRDEAAIPPQHCTYEGGWGGGGAQLSRPLGGDDLKGRKWVSAVTGGQRWHVLCEKDPTGDSNVEKIHGIHSHHSFFLKKIKKIYIDDS